MNKYYKWLSILVALALVSCYRDEMIDNNVAGKGGLVKRCLRNGDDVKMIVDNRIKYKITEEDAEFFALNAVSIFHDQTKLKTRTSIPKTISSVEPVTLKSYTRSASSIDTLMYVVNFSNNGGYAIVSFDNRDEEIIMYGNKGNLDISEIMSASAEDNILKYHIDMIMKYQKYKLDNIRMAEMTNSEYTGIRQKIVSYDSEFDIPTDLTEDPNAGIETRAGIPGSGMPGGGPGMPGGMPGMPGYGCLNSNYTLRIWNGNINAINKAESKFANATCFGPRVAPPEFGHITGLPGMDNDDCPFPPYCDPIVVNLSGYYANYGAILETMGRDTVIVEEIGPLLTTTWGQHKPLNRYAYQNIIVPFTEDYATDDQLWAGCGPLAMAMIMVYHEWPTEFESTFPYYRGAPKRKYLINTPELKKLKTNTDIAKSEYAEDAAIFVREIGDRVGARYTTLGTGIVSLATNGAYKVIRAFNSMGYTTYYDREFPYTEQCFPYLLRSIRDKLPVFVYGFPFKKDGGTDKKEGHCWVIDGYKNTTVRTPYKDFYFDENGDFNSEERGMSTKTIEYVHAVMGFDGDGDDWIIKAVYTFDDTDYKDINFVPTIIRKDKLK